MKKTTTRLLIIVGSAVVSLLLIITLGIAIVSIPRVTNQLLHRFVPSFVNADASVEKLNLRLFSTFPYAEAELIKPIVHIAIPDTDNTLFPHKDTLLVCDTMRAQIHLLALTKNTIKVKNILLNQPQVFLAQNDGLNNWDILPPDDDNDTTSNSLSFLWDDVRLTDGKVCFSSDSLQIEHFLIDSIRLYSHGQYIDTCLQLYADAGIRIEDSRFQMKGYVSDSVDINALIDIPHIENLLALIPDTLRQQTIKDNTLSGKILLSASAQGLYANDLLPRLHAKVLIDNLNGGHPDRQIRLDQLSLRAEAHYDQLNTDSTFVRIDTLLFHSGRSNIHAQALARYKNKKEWLQLNAKAQLHLKEIVQLLNLEQTVRARGRVTADINTYFFLDDLLQRKIYDIHSATTVQGDDVFCAIPDMKMRFFIDSLRLDAKTNMQHTNRRTGKKNMVLLNTRLAFRQMNIKYRRQTQAEVERTFFTLYADNIKPNTTPVLHSSLSLKGIHAQQFDTIHLLAKHLRLSAGMMPDRKASFVPTTTARISMDSVLFATPRNGVVLDSLRLNVGTTPRYRRFRIDTLNHKRIPIADNERQPMAIDSLLRLTNRILNDSTPAEAFLRHFVSTGKVNVKRLGVRHKGDRLRPTINRMELTLNDDTIRLDKFRLRVGRSAVSLKGDVTNFRRYLLRGRTLNANLELKSRRIDLNQLANAFAQQQRKLETLDSISASQDNMAILEDSIESNTLAADTLATDSLLSSLIVLPHNLNLTFNAKVDTVIFSKMRLHEFKGRVRLQNQALTMTNVSTSTEVGNLDISAAYTCRDTTSAQAAATIMMDSVQIGELVAALPELDSVMPMLRSFDGSVACEAAAQLKLKSDLSIDLPTVNAGVWLKGQNLVLMDGETFSEIAKMLMFNKKTRNNIDSLSVELLVRNNQVEIFPFMLSMDKYRVGVGGKQQLDGSLDYHITVFKPLKLGLDIYGTDFDHIRFKLVKAKYQSASSKIGKGGTLIRQQDANVISDLQKAIKRSIHEMETTHHMRIPANTRKPAPVSTSKQSTEIMTAQPTRL